MSERRLDRAGVTVRLIGGGLLVRSGDRCWVIDPTPSGVECLTAGDVRQLAGIVLTGGGARVAAGWLCLLDALGPMGADRSVLTIYPIGDARLPGLGAVWHDHMAGVRVQLDGVAPETPIALGDLEVQLRSIRRGEADWREERVVPSPGGAAELQIGGLRILWIPPSVAGSRIRRLTKGADLVVYALSQTPWPRSEHPWRATLTEAVRDTSGAREVWFVNDRGQSLDHGPVN